MTVRLCAPVLALALGLAALTGPAAGTEKPTPSLFAGSYQGPYTVESPRFGKQEGVLTVSVRADGTVTGKAKNATVGREADLTGSISEEGELKILLEWPDSSYTAKGTVTRTKQGHLKGTVVQYSGKEAVATFEIDLPPQRHPGLGGGGLGW